VDETASSEHVCNADVNPKPLKNQDEFGCFSAIERKCEIAGCIVKRAP
jgi:hypothetical protein